MTVAALFENVKVFPQSCNAWIDAVENMTTDLAPYSMTLGEMSEDCEHRGHLLRVYAVAGDSFWLDHDDILDIVTREFSLADPDMLAQVDAWRSDLHGVRSS